MNEATTFLRPVTTHLRPVSRLPFSLSVNGAAGPAPPPVLQNCWAKATFVRPGGCTVTWRHPASLCRVWGRAQVHCACTRPGSSCHVTSIVPWSERTTLARSQRELVWEKDSATNPEECWEHRWRLFLSKLFAEIILEREPLLWVMLSQVSECTEKIQGLVSLVTRRHFKNYFRKCSETRWVRCSNESHYMNRQFSGESSANKQFLIVWQYQTKRSHGKTTMMVVFPPLVFSIISLKWRNWDLMLVIRV